MITKVEEKIDELKPEPMKYKKVEIHEITMKIPQNAKFGMIISLAILWVAAIKTGFTELFDYLNMGLSRFYIDVVTAMIVTTIVWLVFVSWTRIARRVSRIKIRMPVKSRNNGNKR